MVLQRKPINLFVVPMMLLICWFQWRLLLMVTPKYYVLSWVLRAWPSTVYWCLFLFFVAFVTDRLLHLLMLNSMPQVLLHWTRLSRSLWRTLQSDLERISRFTRQSSANRRIDEDDPWMTSFMNTRNKMDPRTVPCGTPDSTAASLEVWQSTTALWVRPVREDETHPITLLSRL